MDRIAAARDAVRSMLSVRPCRAASLLYFATTTIETYLFFVDRLSDVIAGSHKTVG